MTERIGIGRALQAMLVASVVIPLVLFAGISWYLREERLREATRDVEQTVSLLREHAQRVFETQEHMIARVDQYIAGMTWEEIRHSAEVHGFLRRLVEDSDHVDGLWLIPPDGRTANSADFFPFPEVDASSRAYFQALEAADELHFGEMIVGKLKGNLNFNLSQRRGSPTETFDGLILATADITYFADFWERASRFDRHVAGLFRADGEILVRYPQLDGIPGRLSPESPLLAAMRESERGVYASRSSIDGTRRIYGYARIGRYPITIGYGIDEAAVLAPWGGELALNGMIALASSGMLFAIVLVAFRQSGRLGDAMVSWRATAQHLQTEVDRRERAEDLAAEKQALLDRLEAVTGERKAILDSMIEGVIAYGAEGNVVYWNDAGRIILHLTATQRPDFEEMARRGRLTDDAGTVIAPQETPVARVLRGETLIREEARIDLDDGGHAVCRFRGGPLRDTDGRVTGAVLTFADVTAEKANEERRALLTAELDHRVRNVLATISAMIRITCGTAGTKDELIRALIGRVDAMARAHGLLTAGEDGGAPLGRIVADEVQPYAAEGRLAIDDGQDVLLPARDAVTLALLIHELATNAAKYGSWSTDQGRVEISWQPTVRDGGPERELELTWRERGGPPVRPPGRRGFGSTLIEGAFGFDSDASVDLRFEPKGVECVIRLPARRLAHGGVSDGLRPDEAAGEADLSGLPVLVVEDEPVLRLELAQILERAGADVVGPAATIEAAEQLVAQHRIDAAVLDINIGGRNVSGLATRLHQAGVRIVFLSGYRDPELLSPALRALPRLQKPVTAGDLVARLAYGPDGVRPTAKDGRG